MRERKINLKQLIGKAVNRSNEYLWSLIYSNILLAFC